MSTRELYRYLDRKYGFFSVTDYNIKILNSKLNVLILIDVYLFTYMISEMKLIHIIFQYKLLMYIYYYSFNFEWFLPLRKKKYPPQKEIFPFDFLPTCRLFLTYIRILLSYYSYLYFYSHIATITFVIISLVQLCLPHTVAILEDSSRYDVIISVISLIVMANPMKRACDDLF